MDVLVLKAWLNILGSENVLTDSATISATQTATFATTQRVLAVIRPGNCQDVQACVKIANQYKTPLYPISCGKNWGLGSRVPVEDNCVILELSRLNRIIDYNEKLAYITVEPGVTFRQVYEYLREQKSNLFVSVTGSSPYSSLVGNTLERGEGISPYGDRLAHVCGFEVVLPTGECVHTGFGRFANAKTTAVSRWGVGPYLDGIFTQSNLGIVTKMTMWLMPIPKYFQEFICVINDSYRLEKLIDTLQELVLQETIKSNSFTFWNCYKLLSRLGQYPWKLMGEKTPLSLKERKGIERWFGSGSLYSASREQGLAERRVIEQALEGQVDELIFADQDSKSDLLKENPSLGTPNDKTIKSTYWRKKTKIPLQIDPDRDGCGVIWLCVVFPFDGKQIVEALMSIESTVKSSKFEPNIAMSCTSGRSIQMFIAIMYDRNVPEEDQRAMECYERVFQQLIQEGYIPYRLGIQSMNSLPPAQDDYGKLISILKQGLDPNNILAPGRYDFRSDWPDQT
ncbi:MAG: FAD-binding oxidoreductase [Coleofasciculus sp. S288]|nr:FAD-binding oxidoreductase [Coleofasciculus sp. S288]